MVGEAVHTARMHSIYSRMRATGRGTSKPCQFLFQSRGAVPTPRTNRPPLYSAIDKALSGRKHRRSSHLRNTRAYANTFGDTCHRGERHKRVTPCLRRPNAVGAGVVSPRRKTEHVVEGKGVGIIENAPFSHLRFGHEP
jgi:hypothetical protein